MVIPPLTQDRDTCLYSCTKKTQTMSNRAAQRFTQPRTTYMYS